MPQKKHKPEEIVAKLRQVDVLVSQGQSVAEAVRSIGVTQFTYYRWRKEFGGLKTDQVGKAAEGARDGERATSEGRVKTSESIRRQKNASTTSVWQSTTSPKCSRCLGRREILGDS
jgi:transposase